MGVYSLSKSSINNWTKYPNFAAANPLILPAAYELISTTVLGSSQASVTFDVSTLSTTYKHLQLRMVTRSDAGTAYEELYVRVNGDNAANYARHDLLGNGSAVSSGATASTSNMELGSTLGAGATASTFGATVIDILDPFSTTKNKTFRSLGGRAVSGVNGIALRSGLWMSTAAVTSLTVNKIFGTNFVTGSRFSIYGLRGA